VEKDLWSLQNILLKSLDLVNTIIHATILSVVSFVVIKHSIISAIKELKKQNIL
jgi:hypothetical protein